MYISIISYAYNFIVSLLLKQVTAVGYGWFMARRQDHHHLSDDPPHG